MNRDELITRLVRAGELAFLGGDQAETESYFDRQRFRFHGPGGFVWDYADLTAYFSSVRAAFDERSIRRSLIIVDGNYVACQTSIKGQFVREFTHSPVGPLPPNGKRVAWDLLNIFLFDNMGRLIEEWAQTDYRSLLVNLELSSNNLSLAEHHPDPVVRHRAA
jgi:predicted ester cyclase